MTGLPGDITTITVTGQYLGVTSNPASGTVIFTPSTVLTDTEGQVILTGLPVTAVLDDTGSFSITLPCTDNDSIRPNPFYYTVTEAIGGSGGMYPQPAFNVVLPSSLGASVDISALAPVPSMATPSPGLYVISFNGQSGSVSLPNGTVELSAGQANVSLTTIAAGSLVYLTTQVPGGTVGSPYMASLTPGTGFQVRSTSSFDTSTVAYLVLPPDFA
jgi:hypothetical protein